jgi:hypothetical protein
MPTPSEEPPSPLDAFLAAFMTDREAGTVRSLDEYLARFPGDAERIAREYLALQDGEKPEPSEDRVADYRLIKEIGRGGQGRSHDRGRPWRSIPDDHEQSVAQIDAERPGSVEQSGLKGD